MRSIEDRFEAGQGGAGRSALWRACDIRKPYGILTVMFSRKRCAQSHQKVQAWEKTEKKSQAGRSRTIPLYRSTQATLQWLAECSAFVRRFAIRPAARRS